MMVEAMQPFWLIDVSVSNLVSGEMQVAGVDEAGRGPLVGNVVTAAVILHPQRPIIGLNDSKKLSEKKREALFGEIKAKAVAWSICCATPREIDELNILHATMLAMRRCVESLPILPNEVLIDGNRVPELKVPSRAIVGGDATEACISAASILAKVTRDRQLYELDSRYPQYGFSAHKGYPTKAHLAAMAEHGLIDDYRRSYAPVKQLLVLGDFSAKDFLL